MAKQNTDSRAALDVLVIDDSRVAAQLLVVELKKLGITKADTACDDETAVSKCRHKRYDIILLDYHLNDGVHGGELVRQLRIDGLIKRECGVIMISGDNSSDVVLSVFSDDFDSFITKPVRGEDIRKKIDFIQLSVKRLKPAYDLLDRGQASKCLSYLKAQLLRGDNSKVESFYLKLLEDRGHWEDLDEWISLKSDSRNSPRRDMAEAKLHWRNNHRSKSVATLQRAIERQPRYVPFYDLLSTYLEEQGFSERALRMSQQALILSPSSSTRAIRLAKLAALENDQTVFFEAGRILSRYLPLRDDKWVELVSRYLDLFLMYSRLSRSVAFKKHLQSELLEIRAKCSFRLRQIDTENQKVDCVFDLYMSCFFYEQQMVEETAEYLMLAVSNQVDALYNLESKLQAIALYLSVVAHERWLFSNLRDILVAKKELAKHSEKVRLLVDVSKEDFQRFFLVSRKLDQLHGAIESDPSKVLTDCDLLVERFFESTEIKLLKLNANFESNLDTPNLLEKYSSLKALLPKSMIKWLESIRVSRKECTKARHAFLRELSIPYETGSKGLISESTNRKEVLGMLEG
ncbi:response regulator [Aliagarivorans marinus]|uniref:response regulator n=1 Tax=Aliagarivorans marinus TaxID=561965 RepID=UPI0004015CDD|nr:response regulator [Aliagarivorans marinus]